jgi:Uma2 family endonuclease
MITSIDQLDLNKQYSYADYLTWQFTERVELIKGYLLKMAAPNTFHQRVSRKLAFKIESYLQKSPCELFVAPYDVRLYNRKKSLLTDKEIFSVVQPDMCVICDKTKIDAKGCNGSPDFIIEILSPSNSKVDLKDKYALYEANGVLEYWIIAPYEKYVQQFVLENDKYYLHEVYSETENATPFLFPDLQIYMPDVFEEL